MLVQTWGDVLLATFQDLGAGLVPVVIKLVVALVVLVIGWAIAMALGRAVMEVMHALKVDKALQSVGLEEPMMRAGMHLNSGAFLGGLVKWFVIAVFSLAAFNVLGLTAVTDFLRDVVLSYIPQVIVAALILVSAALLSDWVGRAVAASARAAGLPGSGMAATIARWAIWISAFLAALYQLGIAAALVQVAFTGLVAMLALAGGLSFGLGGKDAAARFIEKIRADMSNHHHS